MRRELGHITKRGNNSYTIVLSLGQDPLTGKRLRHWEAVKGSKKDAERRLAELLHQLETGGYIKPTNTKLATYLTRWLSEYAKPNLSPRGYERYEGIIGELVKELGNVAITQLKPEHINSYYSRKLNAGLNPRTVRYHHAVLHKALATAQKWNIIARNIADNVELPRFKRTEMNTWNESEVARFLETAKGSKYYALFYTALFTGMRRAELLGLQWKDIEFDLIKDSQISINRNLHQLKDGSYVFTQPKTERSRRTIALPPSAFLVLDHHRNEKEALCLMLGKQLSDDDLVFSTPEGKPLRPNTITRAWVDMAKRAEVRPIRLHDARHTHASLMLKWGIHPKVVQERLGHASIQMTLDTYSHVAPGIQEAAAKLFDDAFGSNPVANKEIKPSKEGNLASNKGFE